VCVGSGQIFPELSRCPSMAFKNGRSAGNGRSVVTVLEVVVPACFGVVLPGGLGAPIFLVCLRRKPKIKNKKLM